MANADYVIEEPTIQIQSGKALGTNVLRALAGCIAAIRRKRPGRSADLRRHYRLNDYVLKDIGLTRTEINRAALETFWRE